MSAHLSEPACRFHEEESATHRQMIQNLSQALSRQYE